MFQKSKILNHRLKKTHLTRPLVFPYDNLIVILITIKDSRKGKSGWGNHTSDEAYFDLSKTFFCPNSIMNDIFLSTVFEEEEVRFFYSSLNFSAFKRSRLIVKNVTKKCFSFAQKLPPIRGVYLLAMFTLCHLGSSINDVTFFRQ